MADQVGCRLRVLLVEDDERDAELVLRALRREGATVESARVQDAASMREALARGVWDVVISDWSMPEFSAIGALDVLKESGFDVPFLISSGTVDEETVVEALRAGALDFVSKHKLSRLLPAIRRELAQARVRAEQRRTERELRAAEARYRVLFDGSPFPMFVVDPEAHRFIAVNEAGVRHFGYERQDLLRMTPRELGVDDAGMRQHRTRNGSMLAVEVRSQDFALDGRVARFVIVNDVTPLRKIEEQLRQAQKMEAVGRLAGGIAHDFNNVLSVVLSCGEMLAADLPADDPSRELADEITTAGQRGAELTRQLLMFSRQHVLEPRIVDLNDVLAGMEKMVRRILGADVELATRATRPLGRVRIDPSSVEQVILNLVVNARDAMPRGGKLTLETANAVFDEEYARAHLDAKPGPYVMLSVTDTGLGMDRATQARVFEPFFTTKPSGQGTGLGLSTVFGIVQQSGGAIWVYSEPGRGTTFKVYLPRVDGPDAKSSEPRVSVSRRAAGGTETILLVEDDSQVRAVARNILRRSGYLVLEASDAREAVTHAERHEGTIHLLLTDVVMPQMSGPELARRLARLRPATKIVCMSGYTDDTIVRHGVLDARVAYVQKPLTPDTLNAKIREILDAPPGRHELAGLADS
jgi:signal transduction histidine kinase